jgi:hypothetical protein
MIAVNNVKEPDVLVHFRKHRKSKRVTSSLTGLTFKQFEVLLPFFEEAKLKSQELRLQNKEIKRIQSGGKAGFLFSTYIQLFFILFYLKNYMTFDVLGSIFGFTSAEAHKHVDSLLPVLAQALSSSGHLPATQFSSPEELRKALGSSLEALIDATECQCVRPSDKQKQKQRYSGKKKRHTVKSLIVTKADKTVVMISLIVSGAMHDYALLKEIFDPAKPWFKKITAYVDLGFLGIMTDYTDTNGVKIPYKKPRRSKKNPNPQLTKSQKKYNKKQASIRVSVENVLAGMKSFHCLSHRIRNHLDLFINYFFGVSAGLWNFKNAVK